MFEQIEGQMIGVAIARNPHLRDRTPADLAAQLQATDPLDRALEVMVRAGVYGDAFGTVPDGLTFARLRDSVHGIGLAVEDYGVNRTRCEGEHLTRQMRARGSENWISAAGGCLADAQTRFLPARVTFRERRGKNIREHGATWL